MITINKKAIELSVNFVVWLVLALVVFGMGLTLFKKFFSEAENIKQNLDEQTKKEMLAIMTSSSEQVVIYPSQLTVKKGSGGVFGVGILNIEGDINFEIKSSYQSCYDRDGTLLDCGVDPIGVVDSIKRDIELNKRDIVEVPIRAKKDITSAKYVVKVEILQTGVVNPISTNLVYINVP